MAQANFSNSGAQAAQQPKIPQFRSCLQEASEPIKTTVQGTIPSWLKGSLIRNGSGLRQIGPDKCKHLFDGMALMHQFTIDGQAGTVTYRNKFLRSKTYEANMKANRIVVADFGTAAFPDPCKSILERFMAFFRTEETTDNDCVNFFPIGDEIYASTESKFIRRIDPKTLDTHEREDISKYVAVHGQTAHPHVESDGTLYNLGSNYGKNGSYNVICIPPPKDKREPFEGAKIFCSIPLERPMEPSYYHSFCMTPNYIVFIEMPLILSLVALVNRKMTGKTAAEALMWKPEYNTRFHVVSRATGQVLPTKYISDPFIFFHSINAFEDDGHVVVDLCCYRHGDVVKGLYEASFQPKEGETRLGNWDILQAEARRYVLPLEKEEAAANLNSLTNLNGLTYSTARAVKQEDSAIFCDHEALTKTGYNTAEFPRINYERFNGKKYRFFYGLTRSEQDFISQLIKVDVDTKEVKVWGELNHFPSEPVFIANPGANDEDDGIILSACVHEIEENFGFLLILDAKTFTELARAEFRTPSAIPADFHGMFVSDA